MHLSHHPRNIPKMKKALLSPICSGLIIPGLGQVMNQDLKKGIILLCAVFLLFLAGAFNLLSMLQPLGEGIEQAPSLKEQIGTGHLTLWWILLILYGVLWIYAVIDALLRGNAVDQRELGKDHEILSH